MSQGVEGLAPISGRSAAVLLSVVYRSGTVCTVCTRMTEVKSFGRIICCIKEHSF